MPPPNMSKRRTGSFSIRQSGSSEPTGSRILAEPSNLSSARARSQKPRGTTPTSVLAGVTRRSRCEPKKSKDCTRTISSWRQSSTALPPKELPNSKPREDSGSHLYHACQLDGAGGPESHGLAAAPRNREKGPVRHGGRVQGLLYDLGRIRSGGRLRGPGRCGGGAVQLAARDARQRADENVEGLPRGGLPRDHRLARLAPWEVTYDR